MSELSTIPQPKKFNVLLVGDDCIDIYQYGSVDRISPEAPVPVVKVLSQYQNKGMASNVQKNLEAFGISVSPYLGPVSTKTRIIDTRSKQHIVRLDDDVECDPMEVSALPPLKDFDAVVISDYNKGWVNYDLISHIRSRYSGPVFVDTKKSDLARLEGCIVKINEQEYQRAVSYPTDLIVTLGNNGARYQGQNFPTTKVEVVDVCGAGDTFLATLVAAFLSTGSVRESIVCANYAAAIAVQHSGVYALLPRDIKGILQHAKN